MIYVLADYSSPVCCWFPPVWLQVSGITQRCRHAGNLAGIRRADGDAPRSMTMVVTEWRLPRVLWRC